MKPTPLLAILLATALVAGILTAQVGLSQAGGVPMIYYGDATTVSVFYVDLSTGAPVSFETAALSPQGDPVLHLISQSGIELAVDDNGE